jgi:uncharacterized damage-inducible protein DinB
LSTQQLMFRHHAWANRRVMAVLTAVNTTLLTHSAQHRAQILSILGDWGQKVPDMDYVVMRLEGQTTPDAGHAEKA